MKLSPVIRRIRSTAPIFAKRVGGSSEFAAATVPNSDIATPHCFVIPAGENAITGLTGGDRALFEMDESFATVVCISNVIQRNAGKDAVPADDMLHEVRKQLQQAFAGWYAEKHFSAVRFLRGRHVSMDNSRLWHQYEWGVTYQECMGVPENALDESSIDTIYAKTTVNERQGRPSLIDGIHIEGSEDYPDPTPQELDIERRTRQIIEGADEERVIPKVSDTGQPSEDFHHGVESEDG